VSSSGFWADDELTVLGATESMILTAGATDEHVEVGVVVVDGAVFVRASRGTRSAWYRAALAEHHGVIRAGELVKHVDFAAADPELADAIDSAYQTKYDYHGAIAFVTTPAARAATLALTPRLA
jgi:hypothetical protein